MTSAMGRDVVPSRAGNGAADHTGHIQEAASGLLTQAARTADAQASTTMTRVGDTLTEVAQAINDAAGGMRESQPQIAGFAETAAMKVDEAATYLRDHDASEVLDAVQQTARRQPALIVGGGLILGLLVGRFLRTGATAAQPGSGAYGGSTYRGGAYGGGYAGDHGAAEAVGGGTTYAAGGYTSAAGTSAYGTTGDETTAAGGSGEATAGIVGTDASEYLPSSDAAADLATDAGVDPTSLDVDADDRPSRAR